MVNIMQCSWNAWYKIVNALAGKFVSESKFIDHPSAFIPHIQSPNRPALEALITKPEVEKRLLLRLRKKAETYAQDFAPDGELLGGGPSAKIDVDGVVELYESYIIPLTKEIEVTQLSCVPFPIHWWVTGGLPSATAGWSDTRSNRRTGEKMMNERQYYAITQASFMHHNIDTNKDVAWIWYKSVESVHVHGVEGWMRGS